MKGLVLFSDGSYALKEMPEPELGRNVYAPHDVLIEVAYCGICGSDVHKWKDTDKKGVSSPTSAVVTGHEIVGTVKAVGQDVADIKVDDPVVCELVTFYCGRCINCQTGRINICCNLPSMQQRAHYVTGGGYARYTLWPAKHVHLARQFGADEVINVEKVDLVKRVKEITGGIGFDVVIENTGAASAVEQSLDIARNGGRILISGGGIRGGIMAQLDTRKIIVKELELYGEISHVWTSWMTAIKLVAEGKVRVKPLLSHIFPLEKWEEAFDLAATSPDALRVAINPRI